MTPNIELPEELIDTIKEGILDIASNATRGAAASYTILTELGVSKIAVIVVDEDLGHQIQKFVEKTVQDSNDGTEFIET